MMRTLLRGRALVLGLFLLFGPASAFAEKPKQEVCREVANKAQRVLWDAFRKSADEMFCRKPWVERQADEFAACGLTNTGNLLSNKSKNAWNRFFDRADVGWAALGPRGISAEWEEGTIRSGYKRTFFGPALAYTKSTVEVVKEGGKAEAFVTVCELDMDGKVVSSHRRVFPKGKGQETLSHKVEFKNQVTSILGIVVDTDLSINRFDYRARLQSEAILNSLGPVKGVADLHVHQFMDLAFGGRLYWGSHRGDKKLALAPEVITGRLNPATAKLSADAVIDQVDGPGIDANVLMWAVKNQPDDEGLVQLGGAGYPQYTDWPHHADRSHQQVHISWLQAAHERDVQRDINLNLIVVSIVNNNVLCSALKLVDPYGNVRDHHAADDRVRWTSASWGCSEHENVLRQLEAVHALENQYPWYRVAMNPAHARQIIREGGLAVVLSLETDKPLSSEGGNYGNFIDQLDAYRSMGLSTMQIVHESDSKFCGAAVHRGMMQALQAVHWPFKSLVNLLHADSTFELDDRGYNRRGLTAEGKKLLDALVARHMPIDLAHGSERCRKAIMAHVPDGYGLYDSHTKFKRLLAPDRGEANVGTHVLEREKEFLITENLLQDYIDHRVVVGLRTASVDVYDAPNRRVANDCPGSANSFAQLVQYANDSGLEFAYGTDLNTGVSQLGPRFGPDRCWAAKEILLEEKRTRRPVGPEGTLPPRANQVQDIDGTNYYVDGLANIGWLPELTYDLMALQVPGAHKLTQSAEAYIAMWERAYRASAVKSSGRGVDSWPEPIGVDDGAQIWRNNPTAR